MEAPGQFAPYGEILLLTAALASVAITINAIVYGFSHITFATGTHGDLPSALGRILRTTHIHQYCPCLIGILMMFMTVALPIEDRATSTNIIFPLIFVTVCATVIRR
jgi:amino acid transporter